MVKQAQSNTNTVWRDNANVPDWVIDFNYCTYIIYPSQPESTEYNLCVLYSVLAGPNPLRAGFLIHV